MPLRIPKVIHAGMLHNNITNGHMFPAWPVIPAAVIAIIDIAGKEISHWFIAEKRCFLNLLIPDIVAGNKIIDAINSKNSSICMMII